MGSAFTDELDVEDVGPGFMFETGQGVVFFWGNNCLKSIFIDRYAGIQFESTNGTI